MPAVSGKRVGEAGERVARGLYRARRPTGGGAGRPVRWPPRRRARSRSHGRCSGRGSDVGCGRNDRSHRVVADRRRGHRPERDRSGSRRWPGEGRRFRMAIGRRRHDNGREQGRREREGRDAVPPRLTQGYRWRCSFDTDQADLLGGPLATDNRGDLGGVKAGAPGVRFQASRRVGRIPVGEHTPLQLAQEREGDAGVL